MPDRSSPSVIRKIMHQHGVYPKKRLGQNFLIDGNILKKIADSCAISPEQYLVEIGPGLGGLTQELATRCRGVLAIEIDSTLKPILNTLAADQPNIRILFQDVLKIDIETELQKAFELPKLMPYQVCANIPYNITTPIIFKLLEQCPHMESATLMIQKEVGERLMAVPGTKAYGRLTLSTAYYADVYPSLNVSRNCFHPKPEVDSVVVKIVPQRPKRVLINNESLFKSFVSAAFQKRRKTILNITSMYFGVNKEEADNKLNELGLESNLRPENLSLMDIARLLNAFEP